MHIQRLNEYSLGYEDYILENKVTDLFKKFNMIEIKRLLKEKLDIDENTSKLEIAKKLIILDIKLDIKLFKYNLGALLGGFIFYIISIFLDVAGVDPFTTTNDIPGIPQYILWAAGAILGIYKTYKISNK